MRSRNGRWNVRPAQQSRNSRPRRATYTFDEMSTSLDVMYECGKIAGRRQALEDIAAAQGDDDLMALVDLVRADVKDDVSPHQAETLVAEIEAWLEQGGAA
jgi:hypothetical protein